MQTGRERKSSGGKEQDKGGGTQETGEVREEDREGKEAWERRAGGRVCDRQILASVEVEIKSK